MQQDRILYLIRHAKSSWKDPSLSDLDRPLNKRGHKDAQLMAGRLKKSCASPDTIISSTAIRAKSTATYLATKLGIETADIIVSSKIYEASAAELLSFIEGIDNRHQQVLLVGHNPAITLLLNQLAGYCTDNVPTCGIARIELSTNEWNNAGNAEAKVTDYDYPKRPEL